MAWIHVRHQVADYDAWKAVYDQTASFKRGYNWQTLPDLRRQWRTATMCWCWRSSPRWPMPSASWGSSDLREAMGSAGVTGHPEILVVEGIAEGTA